MRGIIILAATVAILRVGQKRSLARTIAFDAVLLVILSAVFSRRSSGVVIVVCHRFPQRRAMHRKHISDHDLEEDMRLEARTEDIATIPIARIERSGDISFIANRRTQGFLVEARNFPV